jgi:hypothetical protein
MHSALVGDVLPTKPNLKRPCRNSGRNIFGGLDILVNAAGAGRTAAGFWKTSSEENSFLFSKLKLARKRFQMVPCGRFPYLLESDFASRDQYRFRLQRKSASRWLGGLSDQQNSPVCGLFRKQLPARK